MDKDINNREIIYDFIRVISCLCIIGVHSFVVQEDGTYDFIWWFMTGVHAITRIGLPMFVLLSGVLLLNSKEEKTSVFYTKRFIKIVIPLYIYSLIYIYGFAYIEGNYIINFAYVIKQITSGPITYHLWYVYMIIGIYLCTPYIKKMCNSLTEQECKNLFILILTISIIKYLLPVFNINVGITNLIFVDWTLIFILGYLITKEIINKHYKKIYILEFISFVFYFIAKRYFPQIENLESFQITMLFEVMALFLFF